MTNDVGAANKVDRTVVDPRCVAIPAVLDRGDRETVAEVPLERAVAVLEDALTAAGDHPDSSCSREALHAVEVVTPRQGCLIRLQHQKAVPRWCGVSSRCSTTEAAPSAAASGPATPRFTVSGWMSRMKAIWLR